MLSWLVEIGQRIGTGMLTPSQLRGWIEDLVVTDRAQLTFVLHRAPARAAPRLGIHGGRAPPRHQGQDCCWRISLSARKRETVPILELQTVLFPGALLPLRILEVRYMAKACPREGIPFGICLIVGGVERHEPEGQAADATGLADSADFLRKVIAGIGEQRVASPFRLEDASWVGYRLAEILPLRNDVKQKLLELTEPALRLAIPHRFLGQQKLI